MRPRIVFHVIAVIVLAAVVAAAQSPKDKLKPAQPAAESAVLSARETGSGMATGRKSDSVMAPDRNSITSARETGSGMATGKRVSGDPHEYIEPSKSAHAAVSLDGDAKDAAKPSNPLHNDGGAVGSNPLYENKDRTAAQPGSNGSKSPEYKDGEDGTTHSRPENHKPTK